MITLVHLVVSLGMLVIVPLGLSLVIVPGGPTVRRWWLVAAVPGVISLWLGRGALSITLAAIYLAGTLVLAALAATLLVRRKRLRAREIALYTALATPAIAALALGTGILLLGFFLGDPVELLGAAVLTAGMWLVGWAMWRRSRGAERVTKVLLVCFSRHSYGHYVAGAPLGVGACRSDAVPAAALDGCYTWGGERTRLRPLRTAGLASAEGVG